jgi:hypothetical protein
LPSFGVASSRRQRVAVIVELPFAIRATSEIALFFRFLRLSTYQISARRFAITR